MNVYVMTREDLASIDHLQPEGWMPITPYYDFYTSNHYCFPVKVEDDNRIVGIGAAIVHHNTAWLGHIIVSQTHRNRGIGTLITRHLMDVVLAKGYKTIMLIATTMGELIYQKLGFMKEGEYVFLKDGQSKAHYTDHSIPFHEKYKHAILDMDYKVSGERRAELLEPHLKNSRLIVGDNQLLGFYMPTLGEGLIEAFSEQAGIELMQMKLSKNILYAAIPEQNTVAIKFLLENGFIDFRRGIRMYYGDKINWHPDKIYGRIGGNLG